MVPFIRMLPLGAKYGNTNLIDGLAKDGLVDVYGNYQWATVPEFVPAK